MTQILLLLLLLVGVISISIVFIITLNKRTRLSELDRAKATGKKDARAEKKKEKKKNAKKAPPGAAVEQGTEFLSGADEKDILFESGSLTYTGEILGTAAFASEDEVDDYDDRTVLLSEIENDTCIEEDEYQTDIIHEETSELTSRPQRKDDPLKSFDENGSTKEPVPQVEPKEETTSEEDEPTEVLETDSLSQANPDIETSEVEAPCNTPPEVEEPCASPAPSEVESSEIGGRKEDNKGSTCEGVSKANLDSKTHINEEISGKTFEGDLKGHLFIGCRIRSCHFTEADLSGATFQNAEIKDTSFLGACMKGVLLFSSKIESSGFKFADLSGANIISCEIREDDFSKSDFSGSTISNTHFEKSVFDARTDFTGAVLREVTFSDNQPDLTGATKL